MLRILVLTSLAGLVSAHAADATPQEPGHERRQVLSESDLPQHRYTPDSSTVSALLEGGPAFDALAAEVKHDTEATLRDYVIKDPATLRGLHGTLIDLAVLTGDADALETHCAAYVATLQRPADQMLGCIRSRALLATTCPPAADAAPAVERALQQQLERLPWDVVGDDVKQARTRLAMPGKRAMLMGVLDSVVDPAYKARGYIDENTARNVISARLDLACTAPVRDAQVAAYDRYIQPNDAKRADIWASRAVELRADEGLTPVTIAVWDQGTDVSRFQGRLWTNQTERPNGRDDDGNGFIDDIHGIGFDAAHRQTPELLGTYLDGQGTEESTIRDLSIGRADLMAGIASQAAHDFATRLDAASPEEATRLLQAGSAYGFHSHGTMVSDVALRGNPAARLLAVRQSSDLWRIPPPVPSLNDMARSGHDASRIIDYLKAQHVRVVNISWGATPAEYEALLADNGVKGTPGELRAKARQLFDAWGTPLTEAIRNAPDILFVVAAGNAANDVDFSGGLPESLDMPHVLVVGAVDRNGQVSGFSSSGAHVRVYANGEQVSAMLPGTDAGTMLAGGTSIAAPAVTALAGQLFALYPSLDPAEVIDLIVQGATTSNGGQHRLIHPRSSIELLASRRQGQGGR